MTRLNIQEIVKKYGKNEKDTGATPVQIAILTDKINALTLHLQQHKKDHISRNGLMKMVGQRKSLTSYYMKQDMKGYRDLIKDLGLRK